MRTLTDHKLNGLNEALEIQVVDQPGPGGANHRYNIRPVQPITTSDVAGSSQRSRACCDIHFQNGPLNENGVSGISNEALIAVVIDRLRGFQYKRSDTGEFDESKRGDYACRENAVALTHLEESLMWLKSRALARLARGVEGTSKV